MDKGIDTKSFGWLAIVLGIYLIAAFLWRAFVPAHEFPTTALRNLTIGLDLLCLISLIGMQIHNSRRQSPASLGSYILFWVALAAGLGLFAIRLNGTRSWWTGHIKYELRPRSPGEPGYSPSASPVANTVANHSNTAPRTSTPAAPGSPSEAFKAFYAAHKNKDIEAMKMLISKDKFSFVYDMNDRKKADEIIDRALRQYAESPLGPSDDIRNEVITGKTATAETLTPKGNWEPRQFVKEDGKWKLKN